MQNCFFLLEPNFVIINTRLTGGMTYIIRFKQQQDGRALEWTSQEMKGDRELCTAAVAQDWRALQHASEEMKGDRELCMAAVAQALPRLPRTGRLSSTSARR